MERLKKRTLQILSSLLFTAACVTWSVAITSSASAEENFNEGKDQNLQKAAPGLGYLKAHRNVRDPLNILGGPIEFSITQTSGGVHVALPDRRKIDPRVFGSPKLPKAYGGSPLIYGLPLKLRGESNGKYTEVKKVSPFGDKHTVMSSGELSVEAIDATATDAAVTKDSVTFKASWQDKEGNSYSVECDKVSPHGVEYPTFGGVVTNHILHGFTRIGTPLMPTEFAYAAFWGSGRVLKNGKVTAQPVIVHGMLTEYVRKENYELGFDHEVTPTKTHFHLMVPPYLPGKGKFMHKPVKTGFMLPTGEELPFWHVMFQNLTIKSNRG